MVDISKYQKIEAIEDLLDDQELIMANLDAAMNLINKRIQTLQSRMKVRKSANQRVFGYVRLVEFKKAYHINEIKKIAYQQHQDGLRDKLKNLI